MRRRLFSQVYFGIVMVALICAEVTLVVLVLADPLLSPTPPQAAAAVAPPSDPPDPAPEDSGPWSRVTQLASGSVKFERAQIFVLIVLIFGAMGAHPVARRITRRLESLQANVEQLGAGDFSSRIDVDGQDEIGDLARAFNRAAAHIEGLVSNQRHLLASASHELRTPLTRVRMALGLLADEIGDGHEGTSWQMEPAERKKLLSEAERDIEELDGLIGDLLLTSRLRAGARLNRIRPVELTDLLQKEVERFGVRVQGGPVRVSVDPRSVRRMLRNLIENARKYAGGSEIEVTVEKLDGESVRVVVADRGPGVPESDRERIFEPFYRPPGHREGLDGGAGLGLALVREIARFHAGDARCLPREGGGTRFEIDLRGAPAVA